jgi:hypothetical protein
MADFILCGTATMHAYGVHLLESLSQVQLPCQAVQATGQSYASSSPKYIPKVQTSAVPSPERMDESREFTRTGRRGP